MQIYWLLAPSYLKYYTTLSAVHIDIFIGGKVIT